MRIRGFSKTIPAIGMAGFVVAFSYPVLTHLGRIGVVWDWPEFLIRNWVATYSVRHFHQLPLWNPYECGGMPLLAHPSSQMVTPLFALPLLFGPTIGLNLQIPVHLAIAWMGGYVLGEVLGMDVIGRLACASIFPASSWFYLHIGVGHLNFLPSAYLPWVIALMLAGFNRRQLLPCILAGLVLAITFGEGGVYQATQALMFAMLIALFLAAVRGSWWPFAAMAVMVLFAAGFAAVKLIPSWQMMRMHPRPIRELEYTPIGMLLRGLFTRHQFYDRSRLEAWGFWELGAYLSPIAAALAIFGVVGSPRRAGPWMLGAAIFFILSIGGPRFYFPWALLHHLPIFSSERMPERFLILFVLSAAVMGGYGADLLARRWPPFGPIAALLLIAAAAADAWQVSRPNMNAPVDGDLTLTAPSPQFIQVYADPWSMLTLAMANKGALHCNEELDFHDVSKMKVIASNQRGYRGEEYLLGPGQLALSHWSPNALSYDVATPAANVIVINQNYDANWHLVRGRGEVFPHDGLIAVSIPAGGQHLRLAYRSNAFLIGAAISAITCLLTAGLWLGAPRRRDGA